MAKFAYYNAKNLNTSHTPFKLNYDYHLCVSFEENTNLCSWSKLAHKLSAELQDLMTVCQENLHYAQDLQKWAHNKGVKLRSYAPGDKVWLNSKYIKTKRNQMFETMFFWLFQVLHLIEKQTYKLELPKQWRIHNIFPVLLLEQDTTKRERVDKWVMKLELEAGNSKEYKIEAIWDSAVYVSKLWSGQLPGLYYLVTCKEYPKEKNTWEPLSAVHQLKTLINSFYKNQPEKSAATSSPINSVPPMARSTVKPTSLKRKRGRSAGSVSKHEKNWVLDTCNI